MASPSPPKRTSTASSQSLLQSSASPAKRRGSGAAQTGAADARQTSVSSMEDWVAAKREMLQLLRDADPRSDIARLYREANERFASPRSRYRFLSSVIGGSSGGGGGGVAAGIYSGTAGGPRGSDAGTWRASDATFRSSMSSPEKAYQYACYFPDP
eukprot:g4733.t1